MVLLDGELKCRGFVVSSRSARWLMFFLPSLHGWDSLRPAMAAETAQTDNPEAAARTLRRKDICDFSDFVDREGDARSCDLVYGSVWSLNILGGISKR